MNTTRRSRLSAWILFVTFATASFGAQTKTSPPVQARELAQQLEQRVNELLDPQARAAIAVVLDDARLLTVTRGRVDPAQPQPSITANHLFDLGSVAKSVTACAVLRLQELGKLRLDDELGVHFKKLPDSARGVTIRHVLGHCAELPKSVELSDAAQGDGVKAAREILAARDTATPPGSSFAYSNCGYQSLAALVELVAKQPFETFVQRELFARAKLPSATLVGGGAPKNDLRTRRVEGERSFWLEEFPCGFGRKGTTGVLMSVEDLVRWDTALRSGVVLRPESLAQQHAEGPGGYGLGWFVSSGAQGLRLSHDGSVEGYRSQFVRWPERKACIVVLGDSKVDAVGIAAALERVLFPDSTAGNARMGAVKPAFAAVDGTLTLAAQREWRWIRVEDEPDQLHAFLPRNEAGAIPPVAAFLYVDRSEAAKWLAAMRSASEKLGRDAPSCHLVRARGEVLQEPWLQADRLKPFVAEPSETTVRIGLRREAQPAALEIEFDAASLEKFAAALAAVLE